MYGFIIESDTLPYLYKIPTNRGRKRRSLGSTPPRTVREPTPRRLITGWLGVVQSTRGLPTIDYRGNPTLRSLALVMHVLPKNIYPPMVARVDVKNP